MSCDVVGLSLDWSIGSLGGQGCSVVGGAGRTIEGVAGRGGDLRRLRDCVVCFPLPLDLVLVDLQCYIKRIHTCLYHTKNSLLYSGTSLHQWEKSIRSENNWVQVIVSPFSGGCGGCCCLAGGARGDEERLRERERERVRRLPHTGNVQSSLLRQLASFQGPVLLLGSLPDRVELPEAALRHLDTFSLRSRLPFGTFHPRIA